MQAGMRFDEFNYEQLKTGFLFSSENSLKTLTEHCNADLSIRNCSSFIGDDERNTYGEYHLLGYNAVESQLTFRRNMSPPSSGSKNKPSKKPA
jgi:hypothetical protein